MLIFGFIRNVLLLQGCCREDSSFGWLVAWPEVACSYFLPTCIALVPRSTWP